MTSRVWYRAAISGDQLASGQIMEIRRRFAETIEAAGDPEGACLFLVSQATQSGELSPEAGDDRTAEAAAVFFSPASVGAIPSLIVVYGAEPSPPPARDSAELLVGNQRDWDLLPRSNH
jgi:hypothetical protein